MIHMMLGLRVLMNPDDTMEVRGILGHKPLCESELVLGENRLTMSHTG
jgi:hypothetical protein